MARKIEETIYKLTYTANWHTFVECSSSDNIISILCPLREGYKPGIIDVTTILEA